ncbi:MAG: trypsin-like peptidase domain-containing protein, partial [Cyanobacteria bacterium J06635_10]
MSGENQEYKRYKKAIARIYRSWDGAIVGSGFLVCARHILTCAHVVADALGIARNTQDCPEDLVELDFPFPVGEQKQKIKARVVFWKPMSCEWNWNYGEDIAGLKLESDSIEETSMGLALGKYSWNDFQVFGFPIGCDSGVWTKGELRDEVGNGQVQMIVTESSDYYVEGGFSGAPVWVDSLNGVGGIMVAAENSDSEKRKQVKAAFMIPVEVLSEFWCDLKSCIKSKSFISEISNNPVPLSLITKPSSNQKIAELLYLLDYRKQEEEFKNFIGCCKEGVFLVQSNEEEIQRWLLRRLAGCIPDFQQAKKFSIRIRSHPMRRKFDAFWQELGRELGDNLNREKVIQELAKLCQQKSVIIAIYGINSLDTEKVNQLYNFWSDLVKEARSLPRSFRSRLVLLLADKKSSTLLK